MRKDFFLTGKKQVNKIPYSILIKSNLLVELKRNQIKWLCVSQLSEHTIFKTAI